MEGFVDVEHTARIDRPLSGNVVELRIQRSEFLGELCPLRLRERGDHRRGEHLEMTHDGVQLARILARERRDDNARLAIAFMLDDVPVPVQPLKRAANRRSAQPQARGDFGLHDPGAGRKIPADDQLTQLVEGSRDAAGALRLRDLSFFRFDQTGGMVPNRHPPVSASLVRARSGGHNQTLIER